MALRISLKPYEKMMFGRTILVNGSESSNFIIKGKKLPILREKEIMEKSEVNTACKKLYYSIQEIYLDNKFTLESENEVIFQSKEIMNAANSLKLHIADIMSLFILGEYYKSLKKCVDLIEMEAKILSLNTSERESPPQSIH